MAEGEPAVVVQLEQYRGRVHPGNARALHAHRHAIAAHPVRIDAHPRKFPFPADQLAAAGDAPVERSGGGHQRTAGGGTGRQRAGFARLDQVLQAQLDGVQAQLRGQLVHGRLQGKGALGGAVAAQGPGRGAVGVDRVAVVAAGPGPAVERQGLLADRREHGEGVLAVGAGVGQAADVHGAQGAVPVRAEPHGQVHGVAGGGAGKGLAAAVDEPRRPAGFQGDDGRVHLHRHGLLAAEAAAHPGLEHPDAACRQAEQTGQVTAHVEGNLGGGHHLQPAGRIQRGGGPVGLHHGVGLGLGGVAPLDDHLACGQLRLHLAPAGAEGGGDVAGRVRADVHVGEGLLGVYPVGAVQGGLRVEHRGERLPVHPDQGERSQGRGLVRGGDNGHRVAHVAHPVVQDAPVIGRGLGKTLPGQGGAGGGHVRVGEHAGHPGEAPGRRCIDRADAGRGVRAAQQPDHQGVVVQVQVAGVHRPAGDQGQRVDLGDRFADVSHQPTPRKVLMARSCPA